MYAMGESLKPELRGKLRGSVFAMVLIFAILISLSLVALVKLTEYQYRSARIKIFRQEGFYLAEMGIQHALWRLRNNEDGTHISCNLRTLGVGSSCTEHINTSDPDWGPSPYTLEITYTKLREGGSANLTSDDQFRIDARVDYPGL